MPSNQPQSRLGAACGIAFVGSVLLLNSLTGTDNFRLGGEVVAILLFVPFLAYLTALLRAGGDWLATTALCAGMAWLAIKFAGVLPAIIAERDELGPALDAAFTRLGEVSFIASMPALGVCLAAVAAASLRSGALPVWLAWAAAAAAPLLVANGFDLGAEFGPAFLLFLAWTLVTSVVLLRRAIAAPAPTRVAAAAA